LKGGNEIGQEGGMAIGSAISESQSVKILSLGASIFLY